MHQTWSKWSRAIRPYYTMYQSSTKSFRFETCQSFRLYQFQQIEGVIVTKMSCNAQGQQARYLNFRVQDNGIKPSGTLVQQALDIPTRNLDLTIS
jgi:hypothetical protein